MYVWDPHYLFDEDVISYLLCPQAGCGARVVLDGVIYEWKQHTIYDCDCDGIFLYRRYKCSSCGCKFASTSNDVLSKMPQ